MKTPLGIICALCCTVAPLRGQSAAATCTNPQDDEASRLIERADTLDAVYAVSLRFPGCAYDGGTSEELADRVMTLLANDWPRPLSGLTGSPAHDRKRRFVLEAINATGDVDVIRKIRSNAQSRCPTGSEAVCAEIVRQASDAISELRASRIH